jgi:hypothetical protein
MTPEQTHDFLLLKGWVNFYNCFCRGEKRSFYSHADHKTYEVRMNRSRATFSITCKNFLVGGPDYLFNIKTEMKQHEILEEAA